MVYFLMNKDKKVAEFDENFNIITATLLPLSIQKGLTLKKWLHSRLVLYRRTDIFDIFEENDVLDEINMLEITKGVSLNDTFWVKKENDTVSWKDINPYTNDLNKFVADYSFAYKKGIEFEQISSSPEFATDGNFPKCWYKDNNNVIWQVKGGTTFGMNCGNEPYSEVLADELLTYLGIEHLHYTLDNHLNEVVTRCRCICDEVTGIVQLKYVRPDIRTYQQLLDSDKNKDRVIKMLLFDYLSLNTDRHFGNIAYFVDNNTQTVDEMIPIFDNNMSFMPYYIKKYDKSVEKYAFDNDLGEARTADRTSFDTLIKMIDCQFVKEVIKSLQNFSFKTKCPRTEVANEVLQMQIRRYKG